MTFKRPSEERLARKKKSNQHHCVIKTKLSPPLNFYTLSIGLQLLDYNIQIAFHFIIQKTNVSTSLRRFATLDVYNGANSRHCSLVTAQICDTGRSLRRRFATLVAYCGANLRRWSHTVAQIRDKGRSYLFLCATRWSQIRAKLSQIRAKLSHFKRPSSRVSGDSRLTDVKTIANSFSIFNAHNSCLQLNR
ncbi:unnamed protein product [Caenorhabditis angaria]|uniref:Uncharacterized protein n=1 Tax=Caenorhabditis angaria TaxID=860376 RepID=A0A9P1IXZ9_9PELO|nr:unnamed protein product [Caenorhabditis angaria]